MCPIEASIKYRHLEAIYSILSQKIRVLIYDLVGVSSMLEEAA